MPVFSRIDSGDGIYWVRGRKHCMFGRFCQVALQTSYASLQASWQWARCPEAGPFVQASSMPVLTSLVWALCSEPETGLLSQILSGLLASGFVVAATAGSSKGRVTGALTHQGSP